MFSGERGCAEAGDRPVVGYEPFPLPRRRVDPEQVAEDDRVRTAMGEYDDPVVAPIVVP